MVRAMCAHRSHLLIHFVSNYFQYFAERLYDHSAEKQYDIYRQPDIVNCFVHVINGISFELFSKDYIH